MQTFKVSDDKHADRHKPGGPDEILPRDLGAASLDIRWKSQTEYVAGQLVVSPDNVAYVAVADFLSPVDFTEDNLVRVGTTGSTVTKVNYIFPDGGGNVQLGTAANKDTGSNEGNVPVLGVGGKILTSQIPAIAITETFVVSSETEMLALIVQQGDIAIRSDTTKTYILKGNDPTQLSNWVEIASGAGGVASVNGLTGIVVLGASDIGADPVGSAASAQSTAQAYTDSVALAKANNLSDLPNKTTARANLGVMNMILLNATDAIPGGTPSGTLIIRKLT